MLTSLSQCQLISAGRPGETERKGLWSATVNSELFSEIGEMAGLENQIRSLSLGPGPSVNRFMTGAMTASRAAQQPRTVSSMGGGSMIHVVSPTLLNGRSGSRNDTR